MNTSTNNSTPNIFDWLAFAAIQTFFFLQRKVQVCLYDLKRKLNGTYYPPREGWINYNN